MCSSDLVKIRPQQHHSGGDEAQGQNQGHAGGKSLLRWDAAAKEGGQQYHTAASAEKTIDKSCCHTCSGEEDRFFHGRVPPLYVHLRARVRLTAPAFVIQHFLKLWQSVHWSMEGLVS